MLQTSGVQKSQNKWMRMAIFVLILGLIFHFSFALERQIRPIVITVVEYESRRHAMNAFNDTMQHCIAEYPEAYQDLYKLTYAQDGTLQTMQADIYALNRLTALLTLQLEMELERLEDSSLEIPVGSFLGIQALSGRGPAMQMYVLPESSVSVELYDTFESAGINQTKLCVFARFTMDVAVVLSGYSACVTVENDLCLSEVLILGRTPVNYRVDEADS